MPPNSPELKDDTLIAPTAINENLRPKINPATGSLIYKCIAKGNIPEEFRYRLRNPIIASTRERKILCYENMHGQWVPELRGPTSPGITNPDMVNRVVGELRYNSENQAAGVLARAGDAPALSKALNPKPVIGEAAYSATITTHRSPDDRHGRAYDASDTPSEPVKQHVGYTRISIAKRLGLPLIVKPIKPGYKPQDPTNSIVPSDIDTKEMDFNLKFTNAATIMSLNVQTGKWEGQTVPFANIPENPWEIDSHYAEGVFTGKIAYKIEGKRYLFRLSKHMKRLSSNLSALGIKADEKMLREVTCSQLAADDEWIPDARINVGNPDGTTPGELEGLGNRYYGRDVTDSTAFGPGIGGPGVVLTSIGTVVGKYMPKDAKTLKIILLGDRPVNAETAGIKEKANYRRPMSKLMAHKSKGYHEALFTAGEKTGDTSLDRPLENRRLQEGTGCNFILIKYGKVEGEKPTLFIPNPTNHKDILNGITAESVRELAEFEGYNIEYRDITVAELAIADEVMATGTAMSIQGINRIDTELEGENKPVFQSKFGADIGPITKKLIDHMKRILRREHPEEKFNDWMELAE